MTMQLTLNPALDQIAQLGLGESLEKAIGKGKLNNFMSSVSAYADMSPDLGIRKDVNSWMVRRDRQAADFITWSELFGHANNAVLAFIYDSFGEYSGLDFSRVRPNDSLNTHLHFPLVCWFDWSITFCEEFFQTFGVDLSDRFDEADFSTIGEMAEFLVSQVPTTEITAR